MNADGARLMQVQKILSDLIAIWACQKDNQITERNRYNWNFPYEFCAATWLVISKAGTSFGFNFKADET